MAALDEYHALMDMLEDGAGGRRRLDEVDEAPPVRLGEGSDATEGERDEAGGEKPIEGDKQCVLCLWVCICAVGWDWGLSFGFLFCLDLIHTPHPPHQHTATTAAAVAGAAGAGRAGATVRVCFVCVYVAVLCLLVYRLHDLMMSVKLLYPITIIKHKTGWGRGGRWGGW
jgi:hypothetical protein